MRLFIAIPIAEDVKEYIITVQKAFQGFPLRFVKKEQMHMTIDFLGEIPDNKVDGIIKELSKIRFCGFNIRLTNLGTFPSKEQIRVLWLGIENNDVFIGLQKGVRKIFNHRGKFMPHLTIARAKEVINDKRLSDEIDKFKTKTQEFSVDRFILYYSEATSEGHKHHVLREFEAG